MRRVVSIILCVAFVTLAATVFMSTVTDDALVRDMKNAFDNTDGLIAVTAPVLNGDLSTPYTDNLVYYRLVYEMWQCYDDDCEWATLYESSNHQEIDIGHIVVDPTFDVHTYTVRDDTGTDRVLEYTIKRGDTVTVWGQYDGDMIVPHDVHIVSTDYMQTLQDRVRSILWTQNSVALILIIMWVLLLIVNYRRQYSWRVK